MAAPWDDAAGLLPADHLQPEILTRLRQRRHACGPLNRRAAADCRLQGLYRQLQQPLFQLNTLTEPAPANGIPAKATKGGGPVSSDTIYTPVDGWAKVPHGVWLREATAVAVDSTDR
jgi:hypothetical protein